MARYYLHLAYFNGDVAEDQEGSELPSLALAKEQAVLAMRDLVGETIRQGDEPQVDAVVVADNQGTYLATVPLVAALPTKIVGLLKHPEKVVPTSRFEQYRQNADECRSKAEGAVDPDDKVSWLKLADA